MLHSTAMSDRKYWSHLSLLESLVLLKSVLCRLHAVIDIIIPPAFSLTKKKKLCFLLSPEIFGHTLVSLATEE